MSKLTEALIEAKKGDHTLLFNWHARNNSTVVLADIEALLTAQREKCGDMVADSSASLYETELEEKVRTAKLF